ncbi:MAG: class I SAM-dependent methyltransferase [Clostridium sp.]|jgi:ubiquinone/menaquinone biosynthesis C-methylase UbiE|uniref:class I SAM-dependent methyltransferase n=1 Tax=Clostridium sp. TaxID=1506 RepID=UPI0029041CAF|nr:class I SAM-dependent methyltransferase [Clostridium sp.]MDU2681591.1 class I SAM-dependent methyltransferase [Clostridium sp.]
MSYLFKYYSKQYDKFMKIFNLDKNKEIVKVLKDINNLEILDIGGGTGTLANTLINLGANVTILDPEIKMTNIAKEKNNKVNILNGYLTNVGLNDELFDLIIMRDSFHHIEDKEETLKECKRLLNNKGKILIYEFDKTNIITKLIYIFERSCFEKVKMLSKNEMKKLASKYFNNGEIIEISSYEYIYWAEKSN